MRFDTKTGEWVGVDAEEFHPPGDCEIAALVIAGILLTISTILNVKSGMDQKKAFKEQARLKGVEARTEEIRGLALSNDVLQDFIDRDAANNVGAAFGGINLQSGVHKAVATRLQDERDRSLRFARLNTTQRTTTLFGEANALRARGNIIFQQTLASEAGRIGNSILSFTPAGGTGGNANTSGQGST